MRGAGDKVTLPREGIEHRTAKRLRTLDRDREIVGAAAAALGASGRVVSVTRADIQRLVDTWRADLAPSTVRRMVLRAAWLKRQLGRDRRLSEPKSTAGRRRIATLPWLFDELSALLAARRLTAADADALVFVNLSGGPLNYSAPRWASACRAATLEGLRFHDLRSVAASALVAAGVDVKTAQRRLGDANVTMTLQVYARATEEAHRRASDRVRPRGEFAPAPRRTRSSRTRSRLWSPGPGPHTASGSRGPHPGGPGRTA